MREHHRTINVIMLLITLFFAIFLGIAKVLHEKEQEIRASSSVYIKYLRECHLTRAKGAELPNEYAEKTCKEYAYIKHYEEM